MNPPRNTGRVVPANESERRQVKKEQQEAIDRLREWVKPGDTVYTILRHVSRSGMRREISLKLFGDRGQPYDLDYNAAAAIKARVGKRGVIANGCGMDMGFHLVYTLGRVLWPTGYGCIGEKCSNNDHSNGDRSYAVPTPARARRHSVAPCPSVARAAAPTFRHNRSRALRRVRTSSLRFSMTPLMFFPFLFSGALHALHSARQLVTSRCSSRSRSEPTVR